MRNLIFHVVEYSNRSVPPSSILTTPLDKCKNSYTILQNYGFGGGGVQI